MATLLQQMSHQELPNGYQIASPPSRAARYPAASLSEVASAALAANVGTSSSSSESSLSSQQHGQPSIARQSLATGSSNGSQRSWGTEDTSPKSAGPLGLQGAGDLTRVIHRPYTPEAQIGGVGRVETSPVLDESLQFKQGAKRTASGAVKATSNGHAAVGGEQPGLMHGHARAKSSSKAAEISSALKTRLAYAMVKVNHGWEHHSLDQLENISRVTTPSISSPSTTSPRRRRFSVHSEYTDRYATSPDVQYSPTQYSPGFVQQPYARYSPPVVGNSSSAFVGASVPSLAPAAPIAAGRSHRRSQSAKAPPALTTRGLDAYGQPVTPQRQGILRMPSQQAEKDALDSLLFMASPNNSSNLKYTDSPAGPHPLRPELPPTGKRVVFES